MTWKPGELFETCCAADAEKALVLGAKLDVLVLRKAERAGSDVLGVTLEETDMKEDADRTRRGKERVSTILSV